MAIVDQIKNKVLNAQKQDKVDTQRKNLMQKTSQNSVQKNLLNKPQPIQTGLRLTPRQNKQTAFSAKPSTFKSSSGKISASPVRGDDPKLSLAGSAALDDVSTGETLAEIVI